VLSRNNNVGRSAVAMDGNTWSPGLAFTLREPIGLYIAGWNDAGFTKRRCPGGYWRNVRPPPPHGQPGAVFRMELRGTGIGEDLSWEICTHRLPAIE